MTAPRGGRSACAGPASATRVVQARGFYEVLVRGFYDANGDGTGDLPGLISKLDYLQWLGVDCIWLLPFYQSPLRDGGYDISDYSTILPEYGNLGDFVELVDEAHRRGIRVIADLVMNHTSDQHPWFQASPHGPGPGPTATATSGPTPTPAYPDARIIFVDTETVELDLRPGARPVLLAPLLLPPAGPELREPRGSRTR